MPDITEDLREFILNNIDSIAHLEALLLLRQDPSATWTAADTGRRLYTSEDNAAAILARLCADNFVSVDGETYRYDCKSKEQDQMIGELAKVYAKQLIPITNMIHAKRRREFSESVKWRDT